MTQTLRIPTHWSPEQAIAIQQLLILLSEQLWHRYELDIVDLLGPQQAQSLAPVAPPTQTAQIELFDHLTPPDDDDDLPF